MPLNRPLLEKEIELAFKGLVKAAQEDGDTSDQVIKDLASALAGAIENYVRGGTVISTGSGGVTGTAAGPTGVAAVVAFAPVVSSQGNIT